MRQVRAPRPCRLFENDLDMPDDELTDRKAEFVRGERSSTDRQHVTIHPVPDKTAAAITLHTPLYERMKQLLPAYGAAQGAFRLNDLERASTMMVAATARAETDRRSGPARTEPSQRSADRPRRRRPLIGHDRKPVTGTPLPR
jgi:hypothetical protein